MDENKPEFFINRPDESLRSKTKPRKGSAEARKEATMNDYKDAVIEAINDGETLEVITWITDLLVNGKTVSLFEDGVDCFGLLDYYEFSLGCEFEMNGNEVSLK